MNINKMIDDLYKDCILHEELPVPYQEGMEIFLSRLKENLQSSLPLKEVVDNWISVDVSKPTTDSLLLTKSGICIIGDWYKEGWRTHKSHWEKDENGINRYVSAYEDGAITHWQPLPSPPKK